jgi:isopenicillin-N N-acyltransferase-like protein
MVNPTEVHAKPPPLITVKGTHREIGRQIGEACKEQTLCHIENTRTLIDQSFEVLELTWDQAKMQARKYLPFAQEKYPQYVEEMLGLAEGSGASFDDIVVINVLEAVTMDALHLSKCTSMAVNNEYSADGHVLVAHNEDWLPEDEGVVYLIQIYADDEPPILAMTYGALLANIGFNASGIAQCCDSVYPNDSRNGIPRVIVSRAVLAAYTRDAIRSMLVPRKSCRV